MICFILVIKKIKTLKSSFDIKLELISSTMKVYKFPLETRVYVR